MAFTGSPTSSTQYAAQTTGRARVLEANVIEGKLRVARFSYTHSAGAGTGEVNLIRLPAGKYVIFPGLSRIVSSAMATGADLHIGTRAYTNIDGTAVAEDDNRFADNLDAGSAIDQTLPLPAGGTFVVDAKDELVIYAMIDTANIEDTDTISGYIVYARA